MTTDRDRDEKLTQDALGLLRVWDGADPRRVFDRLPDCALTELLAFADRHRIGYAAAAALAPVRAAFGAPSVAPLLAPAQAAREAEAAAIFSQLADIGAALAAAGVEAVALKGGAHVAEAGAPVAWREMIDLDLLVDESALPAAAAALGARGYDADHDAYVPGGDYHYPAFFPPEGRGLTVELHVRLGWDAGASLAPAAVIARSAPSPLPGLRVPAREDRLAHLLHHALTVDRGHARRALRLRDALDWRALGGAGLHEALAGRFAAEGRSELVRDWAALMSAIWNEPCPAAWRRAASGWTGEVLQGIADPEAVARRAARDARGAVLRAIASPDMRRHLARSALNPARLRRFLRRLRPMG